MEPTLHIATLVELVLSITSDFHKTGENGSFFFDFLFLPKFIN